MMHGPARRKYARPPGLEAVELDLFLIRDRATGTVLFMGRVGDPAGTA